MTAYLVLQCIVAAAAVAIGGMGVAVYSRIGWIQDERAGQVATRGHVRWYWAGLAMAFVGAPAVLVALLMLVL